jgi:hypothetical protein
MCKIKPPYFFINIDVFVLEAIKKELSQGANEIIKVIIIFIHPPTYALSE